MEKSVEQLLQAKESGAENGEVKNGADITRVTLSHRPSLRSNEPIIKLFMFC